MSHRECETLQSGGWRACLPTFPEKRFGFGTSCERCRSTRSSSLASFLRMQSIRSATCGFDAGPSSSPLLRANRRLLLTNAGDFGSVRCANAFVDSVCSRTAGRYPQAVSAAAFWPAILPATKHSVMFPASKYRWP